MRSRIVRSLGVLLALVLGASLGLVGTASAADVSSGDVTFYATGDMAHRGECTDGGHYWVGLEPGANYYDWSADVTITKPSGAVHSVTSQSPNSDIGQFGTWCAGRDQAGAYKVDVQFTGYDPSYTVIAEKTLHTTMVFSVEPDVTSQLVVKRTKLGAHKWLVTGRLLYDGTGQPQGRVSLQVLKKGTWRSVTAARTNNDGVVGFAAKPTRAFKKLKFRLHSDAVKHVKASNSKVFRLPPR